jgi:hypothetical protein
MSNVLDQAFIQAMSEMFGQDAQDRLGQKTFSHLRKVWDQGRLEERRAVFTFMRADQQSARCEDKEWASQISWVIGNGTYLTRCDLSHPLSWAASPDEIVLLDGAIEDQLEIRSAPQDPGHFLVNRKVGNRVDLVAHIYVEEDENEVVSHRVEIAHHPYPTSESRFYQTWEACIHSIVASVRARQVRG